MIPDPFCHAASSPLNTKHLYGSASVCTKCPPLGIFDTSLQLKRNDKHGYSGPFSLRHRKAWFSPHSDHHRYIG